ncbi:MAG: hypothetical protein ACK4TF_07260 [Thermodesulfovibrionales bacterium]
MKLFKRLEDIFVAITFAEAGEFDAAREIMKEESQFKGYILKNEEREKENLIIQSLNLKG